MNNIISNYIILILSIWLLFYAISKFKTKMTSNVVDARYFKFLLLTCSSTGVLVAISQIMGLGNLLLLPIGGCVAISFVLLSVICWKGRKVPKARAYCNLYFGSMIFIILLIIVIFILSRFGFFD